ncbi:LCP family protein [Actinophytocola oryzae]|uniref:LytR family transcriptional attenuator n=1 Tax=Actinophytocola oryzae TaxID=502181 RepID=A0A4R7URI8_9PSEU|nr:LCP family protein [Actinophytocola oryzae]TDV36080.1 LytR family transcriptional attenuator [Actinophytocola oryzae]
MSYQQPPRRPGSGQGRPPQGRGGPGYGPEPGYGRSGPGGRKPAYHNTRMLPLPGQDDPRDFNGPPPRRPAPPDDYRRPPVGDEGYPPPPRRRRRPRWGRRILIGVLVLLLIVAGGLVWMDFSLNRVTAIEDYPGRPAEASGTNWLIVGSDSREGLSEEEKAKLTTGDAAGKRTDTIMVAHIPDNDTLPTLLSLPRDSNVEVPGHGVNKINAAFALGGAPLLVKTVEGATGLRIEHYAEISFGGFANIVDDIGGVEMDIPEEMHDTVTGVTIPAGHQTLDGTQALGFVRMRHSSSTPRSDLDRVANQRKFIGALAAEIATPGTLLNPFTLFPMIGSITDALTVDDGDHLWNLASLGFAMNGISDGGTVATTVPVTDGRAIHWDPAKSKALFDALRADTPIPQDALYQ